MSFSLFIAELCSKRCLLQTYSELPPLEPLYALISPIKGDETIFDIVGNNDKPTYYDDLAAHVEMLSVCFNNVGAYVLLDNQERQLQSVSDITASPSKDRAMTMLDRVQEALMGLHGKIGTFCAQ